MQTFTQTFAGAQTWTMNIPGAYFVTLQCTNPINVRLFKGGKKLDLGDMTGLLAGLEIGPLVEPGQNGYQFAFDRVEVDVTGADTIKIGIGNGAARYARLNGSMDLLTIQPAAAAILQRPEAPTGTFKDTSAIAANTPLTVFAAGSNPNGAILLAANGTDSSVALFVQTFVAKATAPTTVIDGDVVAGTTLTANAASQYGSISLALPQYIPAGLGLYFISSVAGGAGHYRSCRYKLL